MNIRYYSYEPGWVFEAMMGMTPEERGCFATLTAYLYMKGGQAEFGPEKLAGLCGTTEMDFARIWKRICEYFVRKNEIFFNKKIKKACREAKRRLQVARRAGLTGAEKRWGRYNGANTNVSVSVSVNEKKSKNTKLSAKIATDALSVQNAIRTLLPPKSMSDRTTVNNFARWVACGVIEGRFNDEIYKRIVDYASEARSGRNPMAYFVTTIKRELGWRPKGEQAG